MSSDPNAAGGLKIWPIQNYAKPLKNETLVYGYSSESTERELYNEYYDRV